jgi:hypothetical protein
MTLHGRGARHHVALLALGGLLACPPGASAGGDFASGAGRVAAEAALQFTVRIPKVALLRIDGAPAWLAVTAQNVAQGYVEVSGISLDVVANSRGDKFLTAAADPAVASSVEVVGLPGSLVANPAGEVQLAPGPRSVVSQRYDVHVRVNLAQGVGAGNHPWPLVLRIAAP